MISATRLARAVAHYAGFETACGRENLLSEYSLAVPVGQCLKAMTLELIEPEHEYPTIPGRYIDYVIREQAAPHLLLDAFETKFIKLSRGSYTQEIFDDLLRLETLPNPRFPEPLGRWFVVAGVWADIEERVLHAAANQGDGGPRVQVFDGILPTTLHRTDTPARVAVDLERSQGAVLRFWANAQREHGLRAVPHEMLIDLRGKHPKDPTPRSYSCLVWRILQREDRREISLL